MAHTISRTIEQPIAIVDVDDDGGVEVAITGCPAANVGGVGSHGVRASFTVAQARELANAIDRAAREAAGYALEREENGEQS